MVHIGQADFEQLKVPLGFIKVVQIPLALITFAALHGWRFDLRVYCSSETASHIYDLTEFNLADIEFKNCNGSEFHIFDTNYGGISKFVGFASIISIMYCLVMLFIYLYQWGNYVADDRYPRLDTAITIFIAFIWFISFWAWWPYSSGLKSMTTKENVQKLLNDQNFCQGIEGCKVNSYAIYAPVTVSLLGCLGCAILFSYNIWIVYKETVWFRSGQMNQSPHMATRDEPPSPAFG